MVFNEIIVHLRSNICMCIQSEKNILQPLSTKFLVTSKLFQMKTWGNFQNNLWSVISVEGGRDAIQFLKK